MKLKKNILFFSYFGLFFFLLFEILSSEKSVFRYFNYLRAINVNLEEINEKSEELKILKSYLKNFENIPEFRELVIKDKLFYKKKDEKVVLYDFNF